MLESVRNRFVHLRRSYAPHDHRPLDGYVATMGAFGAVAVSLAAAARLTERPVPDRPAAADVVLISVATYKLSRMLAVGELISCPFCLTVWVATGLTGGLVLAPRFTRLAATALTATAASDFLQMIYSMAKETAEGDPAEAASDSPGRPKDQAPLAGSALPSGSPRRPEEPAPVASTSEHDPRQPEMIPALSAGDARWPEADGPSRGYPSPTADRPPPQAGQPVNGHIMNRRPME